jgi:hypothetical protein
MTHRKTIHPLVGVLAAAAALGLSACATGPATHAAGQGEMQRQAHYADITEDSIQVFVNRPGQRYDIVRSVRSEVFVVDATSEEEAELQAFRQMIHLAKEAGADAVMEVRRSIVQDSVAQRVETPVPAGASGIFRDDMDPTAVMLDEMTLADYWRGVGTLSGARIDQTFGRRDLSQKSVVFTAKAIRLR